MINDEVDTHTHTHTHTSSISLKMHFFHGLLLLHIYISLFPPFNNSNKIGDHAKSACADGMMGDQDHIDDDRKPILQG